MPETTVDRRKPRTSSRAINTTRTVKAFYCGIEVEIVCQMNYCSLIRFNQKSFVVDTADLVVERDFEETAMRAHYAWAA